MFLVKTRDVPLEQCRGIETIDWNEDLVLVRAPIEQVAQAFTQVRQANLWERDVYEREIEIIGQDFIVFRLRGHSWTLVHGKRILRSRMPLNDEDAQALSHLLHTRAIYFRNSDTGGSIEYHLYDCGESIELLYFSYDLLVGEMDEEEKNVNDLDDEEYQLLLDEEMEEQGACQFQSRLRQIKAEDINNAYNFTNAFLREQDAYVPALSWQQNSTVGQRVTLRLKGLEREDVERMDYVAIK